MCNLLRLGGGVSSNYPADKYELYLETFLARFYFNMSQVQRDIFLPTELLGNVFCTSELQTFLFFPKVYLF